MNYVILCGGKYEVWKTPRQLTEINGEPLVARTIRLLRENGVSNIRISSNNLAFFGRFDVPLFGHDNRWRVYKKGDRLVGDGSWLNAFGFSEFDDSPVCYLMGDVVFSPNAIKTIVETETDDIQFFASAPPFAREYPKPYAEPFAFKVENVVRFKHCVELAKTYEKQHMFKRNPIAWELWQVIKDTPLNVIDYTNYVAINDYTCDIDSEEDIEKFKNIV